VYPIIHFKIVTRITKWKRRKVQRACSDVQMDEPSMSVGAVKTHCSFPETLEVMQYPSLSFLSFKFILNYLNKGIDKYI
jgi:hypothetical protein